MLIYLSVNFRNLRQACRLIIKSSNKINAVDKVWKNNPLFFESQHKLNKNKLDCLEINYLELEFPKFAIDNEYLKNILKTNFNFNESDFEKIYNETFDKNLISFM